MGPRCGPGAPPSSRASAAPGLLAPAGGAGRSLTMSSPHPEPWAPRARPDLVFRRVGEDWVVFDPRTQDIHVLNLAAALVWSFCTGEHPVAEIEARVADAWDGVADPGVRDALDRFRGAGLLAEE